MSITWFLIQEVTRSTILIRKLWIRNKILKNWIVFWKNKIARYISKKERVILISVLECLV